MSFQLGPKNCQLTWQKTVTLKALCSGKTHQALCISLLHSSTSVLSFSAPHNGLHLHHVQPRPWQLFIRSGGVDRTHCSGSGGNLSGRTRDEENVVPALTELPDSGEDEPLGHNCHCPPQIPFSASNRISARYSSLWLPSQATFSHLPWACLLLFSRYVQLFCNPMDCSPLGSSVHGLLQGRILEWVTISFSRVSSQGSNSHLLHWQADSLPLGHVGSLPWVWVRLCVPVLYKGMWGKWCVPLQGPGYLVHLHLSSFFQTHWSWIWWWQNF